MGTPIKVYEAKGGLQNRALYADGRGGPTRAGRYTLLMKTQHVSHSWGPWSEVRWGAQVKEDPAAKDVLFHDDKTRKWKSVRALFKSDPKVRRAARASKIDLDTVDIREIVKEKYQELSGKYELPATWVFNDFGHATWYLFEDKNADGKLNKGSEKISNQFLHTTPANEAQSAAGQKVELDYSHGCMHVKPLDIDEMAAQGYLKSGGRFVVHRYGEKPVIKVNPLSAGKKYHRYEVHFFPGLEQIVVYGF